MRMATRLNMGSVKEKAQRAQVTLGLVSPFYAMALVAVKAASRLVAARQAASFS